MEIIYFEYSPLEITTIILNFISPSFQPIARLTCKLFAKILPPNDIVPKNKELEDYPTLKMYIRKIKRDTKKKNVLEKIGYLYEKLQSTLLYVPDLVNNKNYINDDKFIINHLRIGSNKENLVTLSCGYPVSYCGLIYHLQFECIYSKSEDSGDSQDYTLKELTFKE